jgi:hypothetical protein
MSKIFNFKTQMAVGDRGEKSFVESYPELAPQKSEDRAIDFILKTGASVELKTDDYDMSATSNFFMEVTSHGKLGGPYRAKQDNVDYFVYYFIKNRTFFWFNTNKLCDALDLIISEKKLKLKTIRNNGWEAQGYAVPREALESVLLKKHVFS